LSSNIIVLLGESNATYPAPCVNGKQITSYVRITFLGVGARNARKHGTWLD